ncbi:MAG: M43 family zinc metalloprotease [Bacteroidota bacterium]
MKFFSILLFYFVSCVQIVSGQNTQFCGTDEMHQELFSSRPDLNSGIVRAAKRLSDFTKEYEKTAQPKGGGPYIIPVVFHIVHNGGPENINDSQILDAIKQVNLQFRKMNADTNEIVVPFKQLAADCNIELRLAQLDPDGNCTSGITRSVSPFTLVGNHDVKSVIQWPPDKYLNVYVCNQAAGLAGHSLLPSAADTIPEWDGIVMQHSYVGTIGTSDYFNRTVLTHEIGHYLNLQHIWGGNNVPDYYYLPVGQVGNCTIGDEVADTPPTVGWSTCNLSAQTCGVLENVQNYMDYAYCARMFTDGQRLRMHACLNSPVANRNNLWSIGNLMATGTLEGNDVLCVAKFEADKRLLCVGENLTLTDVSFHGIETRQWSIPGANLSSTSDSIVTASFTTPGLYPVSLTVTKGVDSEQHTEIDFITVINPIGTEDNLYESFEDEVQFETNWTILPSNSDLNWEIYDNKGFSSAQSISVQNFATGYNGIFEFVSDPIDASNLDALELSFDYAYAKKQAGASEVLQIAVSTDCGATWNVRKSLSGNSTLATIPDFVTTPFEPLDDTQWNNESVTNITSTFLTNDLMFKFKFESKGGNNIYLDNIRIAHPSVIGVQELQSNDLMLYPNPTTHLLHCEISEGTQASALLIMDMSGKQLYSEAINNSLNSVINIDFLANGIYQLIVLSENGSITKRFVKN